MSLPEPYYDRDGCTIYCGDCRDILPHLDPVGLVLTDPPYGIGEKWSQGEMVGRNGASRLWGKGETWDDEPIDYATILAVTDAGEHAILWGGNYYPMPPSRQWLLWDKVQEFSGSDAEMAWTNLGGTVRIFRLSRIDAYQNCAEFAKAHPHEKPPQLMRWCIEQAPDNMDTILDPFMGSGTTLVAARDLGRKAIGIEIEEKYCEIAKRRLAQGVLF